MTITLSSFQVCLWAREQESYLNTGFYRYRGKQQIIMYLKSPMMKSKLRNTFVIKRMRPFFLSNYLVFLP